MDIDKSPVTIEEFKRHLRIYTDEMDSELTLMLLAAVEKIEMFTLVSFEDDYEDRDKVPFLLKAAILLTAGRLVENPTDVTDRRISASQNLAEPYKRWDRVNE
ncbi:MAG: head-tail connector protein [Tannerella sp.]|jgi:flagellar motor component MotA|nr:head-tail connector protein [Tannerella sp.]